MPFTLCHPAIVIPLHRHARGFTSLSALAIGSMMPDFVCFFSFGVSAELSHSGSGILLYCVPVGALVWIVHQTLLRPALLAWLPRVVSTRMMWPPAPSVRNPRAVGTILLSLAIGAAPRILPGTRSRIPIPFP
ncbi:DUF4184 family protein [Massilia sp. CCM 8734]|uniref:DUF4184 family protein n=1 Tax=Massilia sp. CCM 8734 TaxID=2609283 RepID=UPI0014240ADD|nr:DUF4184 family protein [Massilia sp. CCM 8734]NIA00171.1 DUF4184 family protein [Massilia sp. CCM 8734]